MEAYTVYEITRVSDSQYPSFAGLQIEDEEITESMRQLHNQILATFRFVE